MSRARSLLLVAAVVAGCSTDANGPATETPAPSLTLSLEPFVMTGLSSPMFLTEPLDDGRIFVVEQGGTIRVVRDGTLQPTPFLDIRSRVVSGGERGLLSVAFHPQYAVNRHFYVYFTGANGEIRIERFTTTADPDVADAMSAKLILGVAHAQFSNHNGGQVAFGPDAKLWAAIGDGGGGGDPLESGQNFNTLLGAMIRLDVDAGDPYAIPADNPFVGQAGRRAEIWAKGLRNAWRFSFDAPTGLVYIADVGQSQREEINVRPHTSAGLNYGWNTMEGSRCYGFSLTGCDQTGLTLPVVEYSHTDGACSVTGGYVYRGAAITGLQGHYFYSDYCAGWLKSFRHQAGIAVDSTDWGITDFGTVVSFGVDYSQELYMIGGGRIYRIVAGHVTLAVDPLIIAHRGASGYRPEHTLEAYALAVEMGADYIEPDLVSTRDGVLVARHENEIGGTTDVADRFPDRRTTKIIDGDSVTGWFTEDFTLAELRTLRARERLAFRSQAYNDRFPVPTFAEVIALADSLGRARGRPVGLYPETKHPTYFREIGLPLEEPLLAELRAAGLDRADAPVLIQSFEVGNLRRLAEMTTVRLIQLIADGAPADHVAGGAVPTYAAMMTPEGLRAVAEYAYGIGPEKRLVLSPIGGGSALVPDAHAAGLQVHVWTVRAEAQFVSAPFEGDVRREIRALVATGVDGMFADHPDIVAGELRVGRSRE